MGKINFWACLFVYLFLCLNAIDVLSYKTCEFLCLHTPTTTAILSVLTPLFDVYSITCVLCRMNGTNRRCWSPVTCRSSPIWKCFSDAFSHWHQGSCPSALYYFLIVTILLQPSLLQISIYLSMNLF